MTNPKKNDRDRPCHQLTISVELGEDFLRQVVTLGGIETWNDLQQRLAPAIGQVWSSDEDAPAISVFFAMPKQAKEHFPDADFQHVWFFDEAEEKPVLLSHMNITAFPIKALSVKDAQVELLLDNNA